MNSCDCVISEPFYTSVILNNSKTKMHRKLLRFENCDKEELYREFELSFTFNVVLYSTFRK